ncbi:MAG: response regulator transcription factor [Proteobacteria bacterium]|jgi:DNA-binding response OmpR family regulator|nr:response regulator transcription factor [Pseudomonadota bacterium]
MTEILLVEDSSEIHQMVLQSVDLHTQVQWAQSLKEARESVRGKSFELFIIDLGLPDGSGIDLCRQLQESHPQTPIFIFTAETDLAKKVLGFSAGADHYITKPICLLELRARIQSCLQKTKARSVLADTFFWKEIQINKLRQVVTLIEGDESTPIDLTTLEFKILLYFASRIGEVILREEILHFVWGRQVHVCQRSVDTHVSKLRKKMGSAAHLIESIHRVGYKFTPTPISATEGDRI